MDLIESARDASDVDEQVNSRLLALVAEAPPTVFDSWALPYLATLHTFVASSVAFIYLHSNETSRGLRCVVSQGPEPERSLSESIDLVTAKDESTRTRFRALVSTFMKAQRPAQILCLMQ